MVVEALLVGSPQALGARLADGVASSGVFVVGGDISDAGVEADGVVVAAGASQLGFEGGRVVDRFEVGVLGFDVPEEALDPGLVSRGAGSSEALGDSERGEELTGGFRLSFPPNRGGLV